MSNAPSGQDHARSILLHVGPRKTGTTAIQHVLATRRDELRSQGVVYPGDVQQHFRAVNRFIGRRQLWEEDHEVSVGERPWKELITEIGDAPRAAISTEILSQVRPHGIERIVGSFPDRSPTVVITYRPFAELLLSTWQQLVKEGLRTPLDEWSRSTVTAHPESSEAPFPRLLDLATLVETWGGVVGDENVAVVLVDRSQPNAIFSAFEEMLALPNGFLAPRSALPGKRSLTAQEAELLRQVNVLLPRDKDSLKQQRQLRKVIADWVDTEPPSASDTKLALPADVVESAGERAHQMVDRVKARLPHITVFGDLDTLAATPAASESQATPANVDTEMAAQWLAQIIALLPT